MRVILTEDMGKLGNAGEVVKVKPGYGRNYLIPQGKAYLATEGRVKDLEHKQRVIEERTRKHVSGLQAVAKEVAKVSLAFEMQSNDEGKLFGSVTNSDIQSRMAELGHEVERRKIELAEPIKQVGEHDVNVRLHREVQVAIKVIVTSSGVLREEDEDADLADSIPNLEEAKAEEDSEE